MKAAANGHKECLEFILNLPEDQQIRADGDYGLDGISMKATENGHKECSEIIQRLLFERIIMGFKRLRKNS
jgi:hypothetical protein